MTIKATICHILDQGKLLLQYKALGRFGEAKWNGPGGKILADEEPKSGAKREVLEETGLRVYDLYYHGCLEFYFGERENPDWLVYIFSTNMFDGVLKSSEEGSLRWFNVDKIPYNKMWEDDTYWLPLVLKGKRFKGKFIFDEEGQKLVDYKLTGSK